MESSKKGEPSKPKAFETPRKLKSKPFRRAFNSSRKINSGFKSRINNKILSAKASAIKHRPMRMSNFGTPSKPKSILKKNFSTAKISKTRVFMNSVAKNSDNASVISGASSKSYIKRRLTDPVEFQLRSASRSMDRKKKRLERELRRKQKEREME